MRFDKKSRKIRTKKKKKKSANSVSFWVYLAVGLLFFAFFYFILYGGHKKQLRKTQQEKIREDMDRICSAARLFYQDNGRYPTNTEGLGVLIRDPEGTTGSANRPGRAGTLDKLPLDPWGMPYRYLGSSSGDPPTLLSFGSDKAEGGTGDAEDVIRKGCTVTGLPPQ